METDKHHIKHVFRACSISPKAADPGGASGCLFLSNIRQMSPPSFQASFPPVVLTSASQMTARITPPLLRSTNPLCFVRALGSAVVHTNTWLERRSTVRMLQSSAKWVGLVLLARSEASCGRSIHSVPIFYSLSSLLFLSFLFIEDHNTPISSADDPKHE